MLPMVRDVDLSPSGEHVAVMRLPGPGQNYVVDVYETARLDEDPYTLGSEHMDIVRVDWANDRRLLIITRQPVEVPGRRVGYNRHSVGASGKVKTLRVEAAVGRHRRRALGRVAEQVQYYPLRVRDLCAASVQAQDDFASSQGRGLGVTGVGQFREEWHRGV